VEIYTSAWEVPFIFKLLQETGKVELSEMMKTFNMGIGFIMVVHPQDELEILQMLKTNGEDPVKIGNVVPGQGVSYI